MQTEETNDKPRFAPETLGRRIASQRALRGLSIEEAAQALGISRQYVWMIENDKHRPSLDLLMKLAGFYRVTETWLLHGDREMAAA